ncbi:MAG: hypothetical protein CME64_16680 [Halobacteriovoraceae bacterium]|nr:hypothetical protein [Halobacteriovoraceae bacterium]|tara:strand:+ start:166188 stop:166478 length:291 start_codon:yes stop_codon:yes gene_type:complete
MLKPDYLFININMNEPHSNRNNEILRDQIHDIRSSLQSLVVANEMVWESYGAVDGKKEILLSTMMRDLKKIESVVGEIEKTFCMEGRDESQHSCSR